MTAPRSRAADPGDASAAADGRPPFVSTAELTASFDACYKASRDRLLLQCFALTGDLAVARSAVREAFVVSWHHWRKTARLADPEMSVRPLAWRKALRRSSTRPIRRRKDIDPQSRAILDGLAALSVTQRKALLLTQLAAVTMEEMAHEVGLPLEAAERELQLGAAQLAMHLQIPTSAIPVSLGSLAGATRSVAWPRVTIIRRAGSARRRAHTVLGGTAAVVALVASGAVVVDATGARPTLDRVAVSPPAAPATSGPAVNTLPDTALLPVESVRAALAGRWTDLGTSDNSSGTGLVLPCQATRYADSDGTAAWVRTFRAGAADDPAGTYVQFAEASRTAERADRTYRRARRWFTACPTPDGGEVPRIQLLATADVPGVGDDATLLTLRSRTDRTTWLVGVARTGLFTTTMSLGTTPARARTARTGAVELLATAVERMCALADGGTCSTGTPRAVARPSYPAGKPAWMLAEVDLPPLVADRGPWVGTPAARLTEDRVDSGVIGCSTVRLYGRFRGQAVRGNRYRTFVLSSAKLPPEVGLTQVVGGLTAGAARTFVARLREQITACPDQDAGAGTEVEQLASSSSRAADLTAWRMSTALPGDRTVNYDVAIVRRGGALSVLVWVSAPRAQIAAADIVALARRAQDRLQSMP